MTARPVEKRRWHIGKEIPVAVLLMLAGQTVGIVWWAAGVSRDVQELARRTANIEMEIKEAKRAIVDGMTPTAVNAAKLEAVAQQVSAMQVQVEAIRQQQARALSK